MFIFHTLFSPYKCIVVIHIIYIIIDYTSRFNVEKERKVHILRVFLDYVNINSDNLVITAKYIYILNDYCMKDLQHHSKSIKKFNKISLLL